MPPEDSTTQAQLSYELAVYQEQIAIIKREIERVSLTTIDLKNALRTIENIKAERVLIPIGGGAMIKGSLLDTSVLVPIGAHYLVEMDRREAEGELEKRINATKKAVERLNDEFNRIATKLKKVSSQLREIQLRTKISSEVDENIHEDYI